MNQCVFWHSARNFLLKLSMNALCDSDIEIRQIAKRVGYPSVAQFSSAFKDSIDLTPHSYRTLMSGKKNYFPTHPAQ